MIKTTFLTLYLFIFALPFYVFSEQIPLQKTTKLTVAVAANFTPTLKQLLPQFERSSNIQVQVVSGSSGNLFQQINHGAPFDIFISADKLRPQQLVDSQLGLADSLKTYAIGTIAFWSSQWHLEQPLPTFDEIMLQLSNNKTKLAIANPKIAPYGLAAKQALLTNNSWHTLDKTALITGININQSFQQIRSGAVPLGVVAVSQLRANNLTGVEIPIADYQPIEQQLVIISASKKHMAASELVKYLLSENTQKQIVKNGYQTLTKPALNHGINNE